jgi:hypothetical protein
MRHTFYVKAVTLLTSSLLLCCVVFWVQAQSQKKTTPTPTPTPEKKLKIEETILRREGKNKAILRSGFEVVKQSDNTATVRRLVVGTRQQPGVEGSFSCDCLSSKGSCSVITQGSRLECSGGCDDCVLTVLTR